MTIWNETDKRKIEKKRITRVANGIGIAFLIGYVGITALQIALASIIPFGLLENEGVTWLMQIVFSAMLFTLPFILMTEYMNTRVSVACSLSRAKKGTTIPLLLFGCGFVVVTNVLGSFTSGIVYKLGLTDSDSALEVSAKNGILLPIIIILAGAFLPGLVEEFALRGIVLGALKRFGAPFAIIASAIMFGTMHSTISQIPATFLFGLYFGFLVIRTGSMWPGIILHTLNNLVAFCLEMLKEYVSSFSYELVSICYLIIMLALGFVGLLMSGKKKLFTLPYDREEQSLTLGEKLKVFCSAPAIIGTFAFIALELLLVQIIRVLGL